VRRVVDSRTEEKTMAKFALFNQGEAQPLQTYEGDEMEQKGDHVYVYQFSKPNREGIRTQVAAVKLGNGQSVKKTSN
jgi:hypothetical protein